MHRDINNKDSEIEEWNARSEQIKYHRSLKLYKPRSLLPNHDPHFVNFHIDIENH